MTLAPLLARARAADARVLLAGREDGVLREAATQLAAAGLTLAGVIAPGERPPESDRRLAEVAELLRRHRPERVRDGIHALDLAADPVRLALGLVALGRADGVVVVGGVAPPHLVEAAEWTLGEAPDRSATRMAHWLVLPDGEPIALADCVLEAPLSPAERVELACRTTAAHARVSVTPSRVTFRTAPSDDPGLVAAALAACSARMPGIPVEADGVLGFRGRGNVLIFPGGESGYAALRTSRDLAGADLIGPVLLGPPGIVAGTTEGASPEAIAGTVAMAVLMAGPART